MAHFAQLNEENIVINVIVVDNKNTLDENGDESEQVGISFCKNILGQNTNWKQTSYNGNFRFRYAGIGFSYSENLDAFIAPQPYPSWSLNEITTEWDPPVPYPQDGNFYDWNEKTQSWVLL